MTDVTEDGQQPAEATLYDDPATADLTAKVTRPGSSSTARSPRRWPQLPAGAALDLTLDPTASGSARRSTR